ncbi:MAG: hypothetical protein Q9M28_11065 [Mariprofundaceae bacterium]|nr:hypothetical protein [Mariprofundaceae bacterium]
MQRLGLLRISLVMLFLFGIYLSIKIPPSSSMTPPASFAGLAAFGLFFLNLGRIRQKHVLPLVLIISIAFVSILFSPEPKHYFFDRFKGLLLFSYTLGIAYMFFLETSRWSREQLSNLFLFFIMFILIGCILENYAGLGSISDAFRQTVFASGVYDGDERDMWFSGIIRPKLFTSEPSHVGKFFILSLIAWLALSTYRWRYAFFIVFFALGFFLIRSPMVAMSIPAALLVYFFLERKKGGGVHRQISFVFSLITFATVGVFLLLTFSFTLLSNRVNAVESGSEDSFNIRILTPVFVTGFTLQKSPLFGAGISGTESIWPEIRAGLNAAGVRKANDYQDLDKLLKNVFFMHWIYYGLLGGVIMLFALHRFMLVMGVRHSLFCFLVISVFANTMAGPHSPRFWTFFVVIMLISQTIAREKKKQQEETEIIKFLELKDVR